MGNDKPTQAEDILEKTFDYLDRILNESSGDEGSADNGCFEGAEEHVEMDENSADSI